jgi:toxin-antitoxin system PIN domain toxin
VIAVDSNILVYAVREDSPWHEPAMACMRELAEGPAPWAIAWPCIHEFLAIVTHPRIYKPPTPLADAILQVDYWKESPSVQFLGEGPGYWEHLKDLLLMGKVLGPVIHDARVAALCRARGVRELWTADRDYSRFEGLRVRNPLLRRPRR